MAQGPAPGARSRFSGAWKHFFFSRAASGCLLSFPMVFFCFPQAEVGFGARGAGVGASFSVTAVHNAPRDRVDPVCLFK